MKLSNYLEYKIDCRNKSKGRGQDVVGDIREDMEHGRSTRLGVEAGSNLILLAPSLYNLGKSFAIPELQFSQL